jgi:putative PIN family toxin of toxin-antitoxin system
MKIILDTNVIVASFATRGLCNAVFELCLDRFEIILSDQILKEISTNLKHKIKLPIPQCDEIVSYLRDNFFISEIDHLEGSLCRDKNDLHVLGLAQRTSAEYIITGDKDLLDLASHKNTRIVIPRQFWTIVKENQRSGM